MVALNTSNLTYFKAAKTFVGKGNQYLVKGNNLPLNNMVFDIVSHHTGKVESFTYDRSFFNYGNLSAWEFVNANGFRLVLHIDD